MATNKNKKPLIDSSILLTGIAAITSILIISLLADNAIHANLIYEKDPCRLIRCEVEGSPLSAQAENFGADPFTGNLRCKCPNNSQPMYEVAHVRKY